MQQITSSLKFPDMFDITHNSVKTLEGNQAIVNRDRLLLLSNPNELYNNPNFGAGLSQYLWTYNTPNTRAIIEQNIKDQLALHEPDVDAEETQFSEKLLSSNNVNAYDTVNEYENEFNMTVGLHTKYADDTALDLNIDKEMQKINVSIVQNEDDSAMTV